LTWLNLGRFSITVEVRRKILWVVTLLEKAAIHTINHVADHMIVFLSLESGNIGLWKAS